MSRSGYSDDCENLGLWRGAVERAIRGKRGQAFLREMAAALDAMSVKELVSGEIVDDDGSVCAIGTVAVARKIDRDKFNDPYDYEGIADTFGVARALVQEIEYENDECGRGKYVACKFVDETPAERWTRMRAWVEANLRKP